MEPIPKVIRRQNLFMRRRDLRALGYRDSAIRAWLRTGDIFRVRHGWYSVPDAPEAAIRAVRIGGRLTSTSALESYGLPVPRSNRLHVAVRSTASRLRSPADRRNRLQSSEPAHVHWLEQKPIGGNVWRASVEDALLAVLREEPRDVAVACCSAAVHHRKVTAAGLDRVFARAPSRVRGWRKLVSRLDEAFGETYFRLWLWDAGLACEQQVHVPGVGRLDTRVSPHTYVEIDGGQHGPTWTGRSPSSWEPDHDRDTTMAIRGDRVLRYTYRQLLADWPRVLAAIRRAIDDDQALEAYRARHPYRPSTTRKRRSFAARGAERAPFP